jgi:hypothetical protein
MGDLSTFLLSSLGFGSTTAYFLLKNHAPSLYYCGVFHLFGHGVPVDYHQALQFFDTAAQLEDPHISATATAARNELTASLKKAKEVRKL